MSTTDAHDALMRDERWQEQWRMYLKDARDLKRKEEEESQKKKEDEDEAEDCRWPRQRPIRLLPKELLPAARLVVRALATLEMVVHDVDADIVIRPGNKSDFVAALKLFEHITMPEYFRLICDKPLFDDYDVVEPCIPIEFTT